MSEFKKFWIYPEMCNNYLPHILQREPVGGDYEKEHFEVIEISALNEAVEIIKDAVNHIGHTPPTTWTEFLKKVER